MIRSWIRPLAFAALVLAAPSLPAQPKKAEKPAAAAKPASAPAKAAAVPTAAKIDINTATAAELEAFPGIGKAIAAKIIKGRPWANKGQLVAKKVMSQAAYDKIKEQLIAKQ